MIKLNKLTHLLGDHQFHDGTSIGEKLNITSAGVWKMIKKLEDYGVTTESIKDKGYRLKEPLILLDEAKIKPHLRAPSMPIEILEKVGSTNDYLKESADQKKISVCLAEMQTAGRGRMERQWHSPFGQNIYCSIRYPFQKDVSELSGLSLVVGLAICKGIEAACALPEPLQVKWPNDVLSHHQKIAGTLIELSAQSHGFCSAVIGIGMNVNMREASKTQINQAWSSLHKITQNYYDRNLLSAKLINHVTHYLERFMQHGLSDFEKEWKERDCLFGKDVQLVCGKTKFSGVGAGINQHGHLVLKLSDGTNKAFSSGDTSLLK